MAHRANVLSGRPWRPVGRALVWGLSLTLLQWAVEQTAVVALLTEVLARFLALAIVKLGADVHLEGLVIQVGADRQAVTANCLGLVAITAYLTGLLAVPSDWAGRWRGIPRGVSLLVLANAFRIVLIIALGAISASVRQIGHLIILVALAPLIILALWGLWLTRDLRALPAYPGRFTGLVALMLLPCVAVWWALLSSYLSVLLVAVKAILLGLLRLPVGSVVFVEEGFRRFLDLTVPEGTLRLEVAARSLSLAPYLALVAASPLPWVRRLRLGAVGLVALLVLHTVEATGLVLLGRMVPFLVSPAEALSDFLTLATGPLLWFLLAAPSKAWVTRVKGPRRRPTSQLFRKSLSE